MSINTDINTLKNVVRIGNVSSINTQDRTARVIFTDKSDLVSGHLKIIKNQETPWIPEIGQMVLCIYLPNGNGDGFILGGI
ncbi:MAG: hypothetical protein E7234_05930 [Lachnospiraceae bacterium]|nr:hypothetical protein [Lachnospiraceae bacterium]